MKLPEEYFSTLPELLQNSDVQLSLDKKEEISIHNKRVIEKVARIVRYGVHVTLSEPFHDISKSSSVIPDQYSFRNLLMLDKM